MRWSVLLLLLAVTLTLSRADPDQPQYQLHVPDADAYLAALPAILQHAYDESTTDDYRSTYLQFLGLVWQELEHTYSPLSAHAYARLEALYPHYLSVLYRQSMNSAMLTAWLRENPVNLDDFDAEHPLKFGKNIITVTPRDFDADGRHEWLLAIQQDTTYQRMEIVSRTASGAYELITTPLPWFGCCESYWSTSSGFLRELRFSDLNQDGLPEWVLALGGLGGNHMNHGQLLILQWQDGQLVDLTGKWGIRYHAPAGGGSPLFPHGVQVDIFDVDANGTREIRVQQNMFDNWGCISTQTRIYGWVGQAYEQINQSKQKDAVQGCAWRSAESAMWLGRYDDAIQHYESGLLLPETNQFIWSAKATLREYAQVRLALAYALNDQPTAAMQRLNYLQAVGIEAPAVQAMHAILRDNIAQSASPADLCLALYQLWADYVYISPEMQQTEGATYHARIPLNAYVGYIADLTSMPDWIPLPKPEKAGCDISAYGMALPAPKKPANSSNLAQKQFMKATYIHAYDVSQAYSLNQPKRFLATARLLVAQIELGFEANEWQARYLLATALRVNGRASEALEHYRYVYEHTPLASWRMLAGLYLLKSSA